MLAAKASGWQARRLSPGRPDGIWFDIVGPRPLTNQRFLRCRGAKESGWAEAADSERDGDYYHTCMLEDDDDEYSDDDTVI